MAVPRITSPNDPALADLCQRLRELAPGLQAPGAWPAEQLALCGAAGVFEWFLPPEFGGQGWSEADVVRGYLQLSAACLTTTFVITQRTGACTRIAAADNDEARRALLPPLVAGRAFATVGISHLTTSRQHLGRPALRAEETAAGFVLDGYSPWVTGAPRAQHVVIGATLADGRQILLALPMDTPGVTAPPAPELVALNASQTGEVRCDRAAVDRRWLLAGPVEQVMKQGPGAKTGGLQTSTLALGLAASAIAHLDEQAQSRRDLAGPAAALQAEQQELAALVLALAGGAPACTTDELRTRANSLVLRATQAALAAAKGAGYVASHPAGRWCREALFFLVWSCPPGVLEANLCELAGLE